MPDEFVTDRGHGFFYSGKDFYTNPVICRFFYAEAVVSSATGSDRVTHDDKAQRSTIAVTPMPPAVQIEIRPRPEPFSSSSFASVATMRAPVAANG